MNSNVSPGDTPMNSDPLIDEVRRLRRELSAEFGDDIERLAAHLREIEERERRAGRPIIKLPVAPRKTA